MYYIRALEEGDNGEMKEVLLKKIKGIPKVAVDSQVTGEQFEEVVEHNVSTSVNVVQFRSSQHTVFTEKFSKLGLNGLDTKRFAVDCISTLAFGHKDIVLYQ